LSPKIWFEIAEDNPQLASDLRREVSQLQNELSSSESRLKIVSELIDNLDKRLEENAMVRIGQVQPSFSNFLEALRSLVNIFGGNNEELDQNTELRALAFADVIDALLINYGNAYRVGFDLTNMSNMDMIGSNGSGSSIMMNNPANGNSSGTGNINMSMHSMNTSPSNMMQYGSGTNSGYSLVDVADYQSAEALAKKAMEVFNMDLKHIPNSNYTAVFVTNLENGLTHLNDSIGNKGSPLDIMTIVHTEIHPNLLAAFNLDLRE
jgi:hypothetical protein